MNIELVGCTGVGKTTLAQRLLQAFEEHGIQAGTQDEFVLKQVRLNWIRGGLARTLILDVCSLIACLITLRKNLRFFWFTIQITARLPVVVPWADKLNLVRNVLKQVGTYEIIRWRASSREVVLVDEGTLHSAHGLFVHVSAKAQSTDLSTFARIVPLPDMAIYLSQSESVLVQRTLKRGHKRIRDLSNDNVERFMKSAVEVFETIVQQLVLDGRLALVDGKGGLLRRQSYQIDERLALVPEIVRAQANCRDGRLSISIHPSLYPNADALR